MVSEKIIDKIRKVLALTKSTYQEEAHAALLKAQELMAQHGLTMAEIQQEEAQEKNVLDTCIYKKRRTTWYEKRLATVVGENFRCHAYTGIGRGICFIGLEQDVDIAKEVYLYALSTMIYLAGEYVKRSRKQIVKGNGLKNDYIIGFINGLKDKFKEQIESKGYALVLVKDALVVQTVNDKKLRKQKSKFTTSGVSDARITGYKDGRSFDEKRMMIR